MAFEHRTQRLDRFERRERGRWRDLRAEPARDQRDPLGTLAKGPDPRAAAEELGATVRSSGIRLQTYDGNVSEAEVADVGVEVGLYVFRGTFVISESDYGILGRNILNLLLLTLDGPRLFWSA